MVLNRNNVYVNMEISMQNLELYVSGTQERGRPGGGGPPVFGRTVSYIRKYYPKICGNLKQRGIKNSV